MADHRCLAQRVSHTSIIYLPPQMVPHQQVRLVGDGRPQMSSTESVTHHHHIFTTIDGPLSTSEACRGWPTIDVQHRECHTPASYIYHHKWSPINKCGLQGMADHRCLAQRVSHTSITYLPPQMVPHQQVRLVGDGRPQMSSTESATHQHHIFTTINGPPSTNEACRG